MNPKLFITLLLFLFTLNLNADETATYEPVSRILNIPSVDAGDLGFYSAKMSLSTTTPLIFKILDLQSIEPVIFSTTTYNANTLDLPFVEVEDAIYSASMLLSSSEPELIFSLESAKPQQIGYISSGNEKIDEVFFNDKGEILSIKEKDEQITSVFIDSEGEGYQIWLDKDMLLSQAVIGNTVLSFSNYTKEKVDVGLIDENGNTHKFRDIPLPRATSLWLNENEEPKVKRMKLTNNKADRIHEGVSLGYDLNTKTVGLLTDYKGALNNGSITSTLWRKIGTNLGSSILISGGSIAFSRNIKEFNLSADNEQAANDIYNIVGSLAICSSTGSLSNCGGALLASSRPIIEVSGLLIHEYQESGRIQEMADNLGSSVKPIISFDHHPSLLESNDLNSTYKVKLIAKAESSIPNANIAGYFWYIYDENNRVINRGSRGEIELVLKSGTYQVKLIVTDEHKAKGELTKTIILKDCKTGNKSEPVSCTIENGSGFKTKSCNSEGQWNEYGSCEVENCKIGFIKSGSQCIEEPKECIPGETDKVSCEVENGLGLNNRTCGANGKWGFSSSCYISACNSGYRVGGNFIFRKCVIDDGCTLIEPVGGSCMSYE